MFTLVAFYDATAHAALAEIDGIADPHVRVQGNDIYVPNLNKLMAVLAGGANMEECQMRSPSLRRLTNQRITPVHYVALPPIDWGGAANFLNDFHLHPRTLDVAEALNAFGVNGAAVAEWVLVWLMDKIEALPGGEIFSILGAGARADVVGTWVNGAIVFTDTLPAGRYAIVGMRCEDAGVVAARCVFPDIAARPGCLGTWGTNYPGLLIFRNGALGNWGEFEHDAPPTIDTLGNASAAHTPEIIFDLIQVRAGRR